MKIFLQKQKIIVHSILFISLMLIMGAISSQDAYAHGEILYFGSNQYEWEVGHSEQIGVYVESDDSIDGVSYTVEYDPAYLEYEDGGELEESGSIYVQNSDISGGTSDMTLLTFQPKASGDIKLVMKDIIFEMSDGTENTIDDVTQDITVLGDVQPEAQPVALSGMKIDGREIPGFSSDVTTYTFYVGASEENIDIQMEPENVTTKVSDTALKEGRNELTVTCYPENGEKQVFTLIVYRASVVGTAVTGNAQTETAFFSGFDARQKIVVAVMLALIVFFVILCIVKISIIRNPDPQKREKTKNSDTDEFLKMYEDKSPVFQDTADDGDENDWIIRADHVTIDFVRDQDEASSLKETVIRTITRQRKKIAFRALDNVTFDIQRGEVFGLIGTNGAGKSTLLKIISGALLPSEGKMFVDKRKVQLLTLGTGFDRELTGKENVYLNGALIGYSKEYIDKKYDDIVRFAELEGFMDERVKNYSSGMVSRLGFSIATCRDAPEILILDEVLSVGDEFFRKKSLARVKEMIHGGSTVILVSHSMRTILDNCDRVLWLEHGKMQAIGDSQTICKAYHQQHE